MKNILSENDFQHTTKRIQSLSKESRRRWGKMTVEQMLSHCSDQIKLAMGEKQPHEKPTFINRNIVKYFGLWLPRIPLKNMKAPVDMNQQFYGSPSADTEIEKRNFLHLLQQFRAASVQRIFQPHPMFGRLSRTQWARFMYVHIDHHLRQFGV